MPMKTLLLLSFLQTRIHVCAFGVTRAVTKVVSRSSHLMSAKTADFEHLEGKTLLSVQQCLEAYSIMKDREAEVNPDASKVVFLDASWWHKGNLNGRKMFEEGPRIPGSKHIDIDDVALTPDLNPSSLPVMLPTPKIFAAAMDEYGIKNQDHVIITARESVYFTPRTWFLFKTFGHDPSKIHLMQGSLEQWIEIGGEVETEAVIVPTFQDLELEEDYNYKVLEVPTNVCDMEEVLGATTNNDRKDSDTVFLLDSRGSSFAKGHIPGAIHLPYSNWVLPGNTLTWKSVDDLRGIFADAGVDPLTQNKIISSCGSGVSACHTLLALELCGRDLRPPNKTKMYDGSWSEWSKNSTTPKTGSNI